MIGERRVIVSDMRTPAGVGTALLYANQASGGAGFTAIILAAPPNVNQPIIFEPPPTLSSTSSPTAWIVVTGPSPDWGGCQIWASVDGGASYGQLGIMMAGGTQGVLTDNFLVGSDPDTVNTLSVNVSMSGTQINSGTTGDADLGVTLAYVGGEIVGYSNALLTATNMYNLDTYLRRGMFGTPVIAHGGGSSFGLIAGHVFSHSYPSIMIGATVNFKFVSFNAVGGNLQDISTCTAYSFTLTGSNQTKGAWATPLSVGGVFGDMAIDPWDGNYEIFDVQAPWNIDFKENFGGSPTPGCSIPPVFGVTLTIQTIDTGGTPTSTGTISFASGSTAGIFSCPPFTLHQGERLRMYAPLSSDTSIAGLFGTIVGSRA